MHAKRLTVEARFWAKVDKDGPLPADPTLGPCWIWLAAKDWQGYGIFTTRQPPERSRNIRAHRFSWVLTNGPVPDGLWVLHRCDVTSCLRPTHLFLGTVLDNNRDASTKGRLSSGDEHYTRARPELVARGDTHYARTHPELLARGVANAQSKLDDQKVREIRLRVAEGETHRCVGSDFCVSSATVWRVVHRKTWRHVV